MTKDEAIAILTQIDIRKKQRDTIWHWRNVRIINGEMIANCKFNVTVFRLQQWFDEATGHVIRIHYGRDMEPGWCDVTFEGRAL